MAHANPNAWLVPVAIEDRYSWESLRLTEIGSFSHIRKARPGIPEHLHTGIDIMRPGDNYEDEPIFAVSPGIVISKRDDGPFAQIIIEHPDGDRKIWTVYEHVSGIRVSVGDNVTPSQPIARFMNKEELARYGWQFNHVHFEVLRHEPRPIKPSAKTPSRYFNTYNLECYTKDELARYYYDPLDFINLHFLTYKR
jgi:murein DD-endopeptidase MepM/ murein hydrolase activator NlpD